jgi:hypothetical protein
MRLRGGWLAHNGLVGGSSPPGPTTQSCAIRHFLVSAEHRRFPAVWCGCIGRFAVSVRKEDRPEAVSGLSSLASENRFPVRGEGAARDSVRMRQRPVCTQEIREELGHDGHAVVDSKLTPAKGLEGRVSGTDAVRG